MKKAFLLCMLLALLFACNKDNDFGNNNACTPPASTFKYKFNGTLIDCNSSLTATRMVHSLVNKEFYGRA